jgi:hypothetical protein
MSENFFLNQEKFPVDLPAVTLRVKKKYLVWENRNKNNYINNNNAAKRLLIYLLPIARCSTC